MKQYYMKVKEMKELLNTFDENQELIISVDVIVKKMLRIEFLQIL